LLKDGQWHDTNEIARKTHLSTIKMQIITEFLTKYRFIRFDRKNGKIKMSRQLAEFFHGISLHEIKKSG
jgi:hypothetical protein